MQELSFAGRTFPLQVTCATIGDMDRYAYRKKWLLHFLKEFERQRRQVGMCAEAIGIQADYLSSIIGPKGKRRLGDDKAREIEQNRCLPEFALDGPVRDYSDPSKVDYRAAIIKTLDVLSDEDLQAVLREARLRTPQFKDHLAQWVDTHPMGIDSAPPDQDAGHPPNRLNKRDGRGRNNLGAKVGVSHVRAKRDT
jgi:hypothetical protein